MQYSVKSNCNNCPVISKCMDAISLIEERQTIQEDEETIHATTDSQVQNYMVAMNQAYTTCETGIIEMKSNILFGKKIPTCGGDLLSYIYALAAAESTID